MSEGSARRAATESAPKPPRRPARPFGRRVRALVSTALPVALIATVLVVATGVPAQAGSGGTGTGDGGGGGKYQRLWEDLSRKNKRWARKTSQCESGGRAKIHGGGGSYHGAFQFMLSTWRSAPKSPGGDPHKRSWRTQAVVAVYLKKRDGAGHWPNCG